jgi:hypothetical protein
MTVSIGIARIRVYFPPQLKIPTVLTLRQEMGITQRYSADDTLIALLPHSDENANTPLSKRNFLNGSPQREDCVPMAFNDLRRELGR